jgi:hypothetical protein
MDEASSQVTNVATRLALGSGQRRPHSFPSPQKKKLAGNVGIGTKDFVNRIFTSLTETRQWNERKSAGKLIPTKKNLEDAQRGTLERSQVMTKVQGTEVQGKKFETFQSTSEVLNLQSGNTPHDTCLSSRTRIGAPAEEERRF